MGYHSSAVILWCFDARFSKQLDLLIKKKKLKFPDIIKIAGGAKDVSHPYVKGQIEKSFKLHHPQAVYLMIHEDCGAYGGKSYNGKKELQRAEKTVRSILKKKGLHATIHSVYEKLPK